jgi:hypothetical protein
MASLNQGVTFAASNSLGAVIMRVLNSAVAIDAKSFPKPFLKVIFEITLTSSSPPDSEYVGRTVCRIQLDIVAIPVPQIAGVGEQVVHLVGAVNW